MMLFVTARLHRFDKHSTSDTPQRERQSSFSISRKERARSMGGGVMIEEYWGQ